LRTEKSLVRFGQVSAEFVWVYCGIVNFFNFKRKVLLKKKSEMQKIINFSLKTRKCIFKGKKYISFLKNQRFNVKMFKSTKRIRFSFKHLILKCKRYPTFIKNQIIVAA